jgi:hypothetical protein
MVDFIETSTIAQNQTAESRISNSVGQRPTRKATPPFVRPARAKAIHKKSMNKI